MKKIQKLIVRILMMAVIFFTSCKKNDQPLNHIPHANAGPDQNILLPANTVKLDGTASIDPDNNISSYKWRKIGGPTFFNIVHPDSVKTAVDQLVQGVYQFELKVTDAKGLSATDTVMITVEATNNRPPIANAGPDKVIELPVNNIILDGSQSTDPDNNITRYGWTKISGPVSINITNSNTAQTQVSNLEQGVYQFELKITDAGGLFAKDTIQITVQPLVMEPCINRPEINVSLVPIGTLSEARVALVSGTAGGKILFAGGFVPNSHYSSRVDIYNIATNAWSTAELTIPERQGMAVASVGNKILFAGGGNNDDGITTSRVDIYNADQNSWSIAELSKPREYLAATVLGNKAFFSGGGTWEPHLKGSQLIDIYDNSTNTWSIDLLKEGRMDHSATTIGNKIYFAGGTSGYYTLLNVLNTIEIFDGSTNAWSTSTLNGDYRMQHASIAVADKIFWAGGTKYASLGSGFRQSDNVEIRNVTTGISSYACINSRYHFNAVTKNDNIVFFTGINENNTDNRIDIYNTTLNKWSVGLLPNSISQSTIISVNNTIYVAGGYVNGIISAQVWKLEF